MNGDHEVRKYRKKVNENGWMRKYQVWCFDSLTPKFVGYCPFFWFTWLCVLFLPLILLGKILEPIGRLLKGILTFSTKRKEYRIEKPSDASLRGFYRRFRTYTDLESAREALSNVYPDVYEWIDITPDWEPYCRELLAREERRIANKAIWAIKREKIVLFLAIYGGAIVKPLVVLIALAASFYTVKFMWWIVKQITLEDILFALKFLLMLIVVCFIISGLYRFGQFLKNVFTRSAPRKLRARQSVLSKILLAVGDTIGGVLSFLFETIEMTYKQECPLIEWSDKSSRIERNQVQS